MFPLHFPYRASSCAIRFQLGSTSEVEVSIISCDVKIEPQVRHGIEFSLSTPRSHIAVGIVALPLLLVNSRRVPTLYLLPYRKIWCSHTGGEHSSLMTYYAVPNGKSLRDMSNKLAASIYRVYQSTLLWLVHLETGSMLSSVILCSRHCANTAENLDFSSSQFITHSHSPWSEVWSGVLAKENEIFVMFLACVSVFINNLSVTHPSTRVGQVELRVNSHHIDQITSES
jgi:hypothetical protein